MNDSNDKAALNVLRLATLLIGFLGIVAIVVDSLTMAVVAVAFSIMWLGFFLVMTYLDVTDILMQALTNRIDEIWQNVYEHWPRSR